MIRILAIPVLGLSLALASAQALAGRDSAPSRNVNELREVGEIPGQYIVVFKDSVGDSRGLANALARQHGFGLRHAYGAALKGFAAAMPDAVADRLARDSRVSYVVPDRIDRLYQSPTGVDRMESDLRLSEGASLGVPIDVDVAIIDTGVDANHPSLNVYRSVNFAGGKGGDKHGHGSHVAGTVAAMDSGDGIVGVAPGARIWAIQVCKPNGSCARSAIIAGIDFITANAGEIEVANMSLGGGGSDDGNCGLTNNDPEHTAICNAVGAGIVFVVAAGNESDDAANHVPAAYDEVITVSALADFDGMGGGAAGATCRSDQDDSLASFSNYGADVDLMAPGVCILSTYKSGGTATMSGTSMASPHVAGAAALYIAQNGRATDAPGVATIRAALVAGGIAQVDGNCGLAVFDDPDGGTNAEPIVFANAAAAGGSGACDTSTSNDAPAVTVLAPGDGVTFDSGASIGFSGDASDTEDADLTAADLVWTSNIDGQIGTGASFSAVLNDGNHSITAQATDSGGKTGGDSVIVTVGAPPPAGAMVIADSIGYVWQGGGKHLLITVAVVDDIGTPVVGANVSITLTNTDLGQSWIGGPSATGDLGTVSWKLRNAPKGCYDTVVDNLTADGLTWDSTSPTDLGTCN